MYINFIDKDLIILAKDQLSKNLDRLKAEEQAFQPSQGLISKLTNLNLKLNKLILSLGDIGLKISIHDFFESTIKQSSLLKELIGSKKNVAISYVSGLVYYKRKIICKIETSNILNRIADITVDDMYCVSNILLNEEDIYKPIVNKLYEKNIIFDIEVFSLNIRYWNNKAKYYSNAIRIIKKINAFIDEYQIYEFFQCQSDFGRIKSNKFSEDIIIYLSSNMKIVLKENDNSNYHKKTAFKILYSVNEYKYFTCFKQFQKFIYKSYILKKKLIKILNIKNVDPNYHPIRYIIGQSDTNSENNEYFSLVIDDFYNCLNKSSTLIKLRINDFNDKSINDIVKIIFKVYYTENKDIKSLCTYEDFLRNKNAIFENLKLIFY